MQVAEYALSHSLPTRVLTTLAQTAGCVLARRLTDEGNFTVAVLEAGRAHGNDPKIRTHASLSNARATI